MKQKEKDKGGSIKVVAKNASCCMLRASGVKGQSLIEILIAIVVGVVMVLAAATLIAPALRSNTQVNRIQVAAALGKELLENVRVLAEADWHSIANLATSSANTYHLSSSSPFTAIAGIESIDIATTTYTRYFYTEDVMRDSSGNIIASGGIHDLSTKKVSVAYRWPQGTTTTVSTYLTRTRNEVFIQTDWSGGPGQEGPVSSTNSRFSTSSSVHYTTTTGSILINL